MCLKYNSHEVWWYYCSRDLEESNQAETSQIMSLSYTRGVIFGKHEHILFAKVEACRTREHNLALVR